MGTFCLTERSWNFLVHQYELSTAHCSPIRAATPSTKIISVCKELVWTLTTNMDSIDVNVYKGIRIVEIIQILNNYLMKFLSVCWNCYLNIQYPYSILNVQLGKDILCVNISYSSFNIIFIVFVYMFLALIGTLYSIFI